MYLKTLLVSVVCCLTCLHLGNVDGSMNSRRMIQVMKCSSPEVRKVEAIAMKILKVTKSLMKSKPDMSLSDLQKSNKMIWKWRRHTNACQQKLIDCSRASKTFRSASGICNNLANPEYGESNKAQSRFLPPQYDDGVDSPRTQNKDCEPLPSARLVSNCVFKSNRKRTETDLSLMVMAWGQFLDHDITLTPEASGAEEKHCCDSTDTLPQCFPIKIPRNDAHFTSSDCMEFVRSAAITDTCSISHREQLNALTAFVDGSNVYGSTLDQMNDLRAFHKGLLKTSAISSSLPPEGDPHSCNLNSTTEFCIKVGDARANVVPHLGANHVLFFREHNRIASILSKMNCNWNDERVFQETRKIISGILQQISYYEWLPSILSPSYLTKFNLKKSNNDPYKPGVNPTIRNGFAVAAMRFGHTLVPPLEAYLLRDYATFEVKKPIQNTFFRPTLVINNAGQDIPKLARWVCYNNSMKMDRIFETGIRDKLFLDSDGRSLDLAALNIQRGRDHGVPPYNEFRKKFGLQKLKTFHYMPNHNRWDRYRLKAAYRNVDDIDLFAGGMSETRVCGGNLGPTFSAMIATQFQLLKEGDRFWFERPAPEGFSPEQRREIRKMTLAKVMCTNFGMELITKDVFRIRSPKNELEYCDDIKGMDLTKWKA